MLFQLSPVSSLPLELRIFSTPTGLSSLGFPLDSLSIRLRSIAAYLLSRAYHRSSLSLPPSLPLSLSPLRLFSLSYYTPWRPLIKFPGRSLSTFFLFFLLCFFFGAVLLDSAGMCRCVLVPIKSCRGGNRRTDGQTGRRADGQTGRRADGQNRTVYVRMPTCSSVAWMKTHLRCHNLDHQRKKCPPKDQKANGLPGIVTKPSPRTMASAGI